jgi:hypothetical protein
MPVKLGRAATLAATALFMSSGVASGNTVKGDTGVGSVVEALACGGGTTKVPDATPVDDRFVKPVCSKLGVL